MTPIILSVYQNFPSSAALLVGNTIVAATHEERFSRVKNEERHPAESIQFCLNYASVDANSVDVVALASHEMNYGQAYYRTSRWSIQDYLTEQHKRWRPWLIEGQAKRELKDIFPEKGDSTVFPPGWTDLTESLGGTNAAFHQVREQLFADWFGVPKERIRTVEHHLSHAYYSYYASNFRGEAVLAITLDGWGDGLNFTLGYFDEFGKYSRITQSSDCAIARIYRYMTLALGMKPNEHEYKVMGLAPYGESRQGYEVYEIFRDTLQVSGTDFVWKTKPTDSYFWFRDRLEGYRFDAIAFGLQHWVEDLVLQIVRAGIKHTGLRKVVLSGGVAMNVKAMGRLCELAELEEVFVGGTPADDTLAIGAAYSALEDLTTDQGGAWDSRTVPPLSSLYLGADVSQKDQAKAISSLSTDKYEVHHAPSHSEIAAILASGRILGRCVGRMEFGQRALGNRSLLADPKFPGVKERINAAIKHRDFWMPFAPLVLDTFAERYLISVDKANCTYMSIGMQTTEEGFQAMLAACHPADRSARPQVLRRDTNPDLYDLLVEFAHQTGRGALLNTSFNLHGYPIVQNAQEAVSVLDQTDLDGLIFSNYLVLRSP